MRPQEILFADDGFSALADVLRRNGIRRLLLVHGKRSYERLRVSSALADICVKQNIRCTHFTDFEPNPAYISVKRGVRLLQRERADMILAVGGGSSMDVAKCIKLYGTGNPDAFLLTQEGCCADIPLAVLPTTAGTGSEATRYAVVYHAGAKQSVHSERITPDLILFDDTVLTTLPPAQRKATYLDALSHAVESYWSVNATEVSRSYAAEAIGLLTGSTAYLDPQEVFAAYGDMLRASYLSGRAIDISATTAGHAMCYKLTSLFDIPHGQAAALCMVRLWRWMLERGDIPAVLDGLAGCFAAGSSEGALGWVERHLREWRLLSPLKAASDTDFDAVIAQLAETVNPVRLKNHPVRISRQDVEELYRKILLGVF